MAGKRRVLNLDDGPLFIPKAPRPHVAQEYVELYGLDTDRVLEHVIRLHPRVRHQALGMDRGTVPYPWMKQHISRPKKEQHGRSELDARAAA